MSYERYLFWGLLGSAAPDTDHLYLLLFDGRQPDHHLYFTHYPLFWLSLLLFSSIWLAISKKDEHKSLFAFLFSLEGTIHMILDSITGHMYWMAPFSLKSFSIEERMLAKIPWFAKQYPFWELSLEAVIIFWAVYLLIKDRNAGKIRAKLTSRTV